MSIYSVKGKGWRYDFTLKGTRHTEAWFPTKKEAQSAEAKRKEEIQNPAIPIVKEATPIDMGFLELVNRRLDHVKAYNSPEHFRHVLYHAKRWVKEWQGRACSEINSEMIEGYVLARSQTSTNTANKEIRYLRALFNFGMNLKIIDENPAEVIKFLPVVKKKKYIPLKEDVYQVISVADPDSQDYLWALVLTGARMNEINFLTWEDVNFENRSVTLWTSKKKHGNREPRDVPMLQKLYEILYYRYQNRDPDKPWVFWHRYWSRKINDFVEGPFIERNRLMESLCKKTSVKYFRFHSFRHFTASILDDIGTPIGVIQRILGHTNRKTTEGYLHSIGEAERTAMENLGNLKLYSVDQPTVLNKPINRHKEYWQRKSERPEYNVLCEDIEHLGYVGTGRKYGVSDNAIRKWRRSYENEIENQKSLTQSLTR